MLFCGENIKTEERNGLLIDGGAGSLILEFVDIENIEDLCALVPGQKGEKFIVDARNILEKRLFKKLRG